MPITFGMLNSVKCRWAYGFSLMSIPYAVPSARCIDEIDDGACYLVDGLE